MECFRRMILAIFAVALFLWPTGEVWAQKFSLKFMTGPMGGAWYPLGGAIADVLQRQIPEVNVTVSPGGSIANAEAIEGGKCEIGFSHSSAAVDGIQGRPPFKQKMENMRQLANLYPQYFHILVMENSWINSVADLKGKIICPGKKGDAIEVWTRQLLEIYGLSYKDMAKVQHVGWSDAVALMKDGHAHAFLLGTTIPASSVMELAADRKIRLLALPEDKIKGFEKINAGYIKRVIPKGTYRGVDHDVLAVGNFAHLIISAKLPEDLVYKITKALVSELPGFGNIVRDMKGVTPKDLALDIGVPFHPGALRYYKEVKAL